MQCKETIDTKAKHVNDIFEIDESGDFKIKV